MRFLTVIYQNMKNTYVFFKKINFHGIRGVTKFDGTRGKRQIWRSKLETEVFRKQLYCIKESTCDNVGTFRRPRSDSALP